MIWKPTGLKKNLYKESPEVVQQMQALLDQCRRQERTVPLSTDAPKALPGGAANSTAAERKPNIILILADDLGYGDLGC